MSTYNKICVSEDQAKNTGFRKPDCLESLLTLPIISKQFAFATVAAFETVATWKAAIVAKNLVPLFDIYEVADGSTEDTFFESGNFKKRTIKGADILTGEMYLSVCAYETLKSYEDNDEYLELFEFNEDADYSGVYDTDGVRVRGRRIKSLTVERKRATKEKVPFVTVEIIFEDKDEILNTVLTKSDLVKDDLDGIYDLELVEEAGNSATSIKFTAVSHCAGGTLVTNLVTADIDLLDLTGTTHAHAFVAADANGVYELTGVDFLTGFTVVGTGVIEQVDINYEIPEALSITVT